MSPGPGSYEANENVVKSGSKQAKIGSAKRDLMTIDEEKPGPGMYDQKSSFVG